MIASLAPTWQNILNELFVHMLHSSSYKTKQAPPPSVQSLYTHKQLYITPGDNFPSSSEDCSSVLLFACTSKLSPPTRTIHSSSFISTFTVDQIHSDSVELVVVVLEKRSIPPTVESLLVEMEAEELESIHLRWSPCRSSRFEERSRKERRRVEDRCWPE